MWNSCQLLIREEKKNPQKTVLEKGKTWRDDVFMQDPKWGRGRRLSITGKTLVGGPFHNREVIGIQLTGPGEGQIVMGSLQ